MKSRPTRASIRADAPGAPMEGSDAGSADDLVQAYLESSVRLHRRQAAQAFKDAQHYKAKDPERAMAVVGTALISAARAFWWAEDSPLEERQHQLMHQIGRWKRKNLGCSLSHDGTRYTQKCPVAIAHKKIGFSIGFTAIRFCSICREDLSSDACSHFRDRTYWVRGGAHSGDPCRLCNKNSCPHRSDTLYRARVVSVIDENSKINIQEVSIVRKPAQPEARLVEIPVDLQKLAKRLGPDFLPGVRIPCNQCIEPCSGFSEIEDY